MIKVLETPAPSVSTSASSVTTTSSAAPEATTSSAAVAAASMVVNIIILLHESEGATGSRGFGRRDDHAVLVSLEELLAVTNAPILLVGRVLRQLEPELVERLVYRPVRVMTAIALVVKSDLTRGRHLHNVLVVDVNYHRAVVALKDSLALLDGKKPKKKKTKESNGGEGRRGKGG